MKIVLDTNVLVSGLLSPFGPPAEIVRMVAADILQLCYDARIINEYRDVLKRPKFQLNHETISILMDQIKFRGDLAVAEPLTNNLPDEGDGPFLEVAIDSDAAFLITGNVKHYPVSFRKDVKVVTPTEFLRIYKKIKST